MFDTVSWQTGSELRSFGDSEMKTLTSHFHHLISNHSLEMVTEDILNKLYEARVLGTVPEEEA